MDDVIAVKIENTNEQNPQMLHRQLNDNNQNESENVTNFDEMSPPNKKRRKTKANPKVVSLPDKAGMKVCLVKNSFQINVFSLIKRE